MTFCSHLLQLARHSVPSSREGGSDWFLGSNVCSGLATNSCLSQNGPQALFHSWRCSGQILLERVGLESGVTNWARGQITTEYCSHILFGQHSILEDLELECFGAEYALSS